MYDTKSRKKIRPPLRAPRAFQTIVNFSFMSSSRRSSGRALNSSVKSSSSFISPLYTQSEIKTKSATLSSERTLQKNYLGTTGICR